VKQVNQSNNIIIVNGLVVMDIVQQIELVDVNKDGLENFAREVNLIIVNLI